MEILIVGVGIAGNPDVCKRPWNGQRTKLLNRASRPQHPHDSCTSPRAAVREWIVRGGESDETV